MPAPIETGERIARSLWPKRGTHGVTCYAWRQNIAVSVLALLFAVPCWAFIAYGGAEKAGIHGFATTDKVADLSDKLGYLTRRQLSDDIQDTYGRMCNSQGQQRREYSRRMTELKIQYKLWFKDDYPNLELC